MSTLNPDRAAAKQFADAHGYFWLPCPRCGTWFGGHEWGSSEDVRCREGGDDPSVTTRHGTCGTCKPGTEEEETAACARAHKLYEAYP
jgi:hypothetical protein